MRFYESYRFSIRIAGNARSVRTRAISIQCEVKPVLTGRLLDFTPTEDYGALFGYLVMAITTKFWALNRTLREPVLSGVGIIFGEIPARLIRLGSLTTIEQDELHSLYWRINLLRSSISNFQKIFPVSLFRLKPKQTILDLSQV